MPKPILLIVLLLILPYTAGAQESPPQTKVTVDKANAFTTILELAKAADLVVVGTVSTDQTYDRLKPTLSEKLTSEQKKRLQDVSMPIMLTGVIVEEVLKGTEGILGDIVNVMQFGGDGHDMPSASISGVTHLDAGSTVLLFLARYIDPQGQATENFTILGVEDGMLLVTANGLKKPVHSESSLSKVPANLSEVRRQVAQEIQP